MADGAFTVGTFALFDFALFPRVACARYVDEVLHLGPGIKAGLFPDLSVETIPGAGHWVHVTNPKELHAAVAALVRRKPRLT